MTPDDTRRAALLLKESGGPFMGMCLLMAQLREREEQVEAQRLEILGLRLLDAAVLSEENERLQHKIASLEDVLVRAKAVIESEWTL